MREIIALRDDEKFKKPQLPSIGSAKSESSATSSPSTQTDLGKSEQNRTWYHEGPVSLKTARLWIAEFSLPKADERLKNQRKLRQEGDALTSWRAMLQEQQSTIRTLSNSHSQVGDTRPLTHCTFSPNGQVISCLMISFSWENLSDRQVIQKVVFVFCAFSIFSPRIFPECMKSYRNKLVNGLSVF